MGVAASIVSAVLKSVVGDKIGDGLIKDLIGISIDEASGKGINEIANFINGEKSKIDSIFSKDNMESMGIPEDKTAYVIAEIKELLSKIDITDEVFRRCKYNNMILKDFMWEEYVAFRNKPNHIECESEIKTCIFALVEVLNNAMRESEDFSNKMLIQISNAADDANIGLRKISEYMEDNFAKLDNNSQIVLNILLMILGQIQTMNMKDNETNSTTNEVKKFKNNKKEDYIKTWNSRLFLHIDNDENPITLEEAFIMPDYKMHKSISRIGFSNDDTLDKIIEKFIKYKRTSTMLITGVPGTGKSSITSWIANKYRDNDEVIILRFRDWNNTDLIQGLLKAICCSLDCVGEDLENKVIVLDGFDEIKSVNERKSLIREFFNDFLDVDNLKIIITSKPDYLDTHDFQNVCEIFPFNAFQIKQFYQIIKGTDLNQEKIDSSNLDILGIPVILYMAIMVDIDLTLKTKKPELYNWIFAEKGGIFDRFCFKGIDYDGGFKPIRDKENVEIYLDFLRQAAFSMFEKNDLVLTEREYDIPKLVHQGDKLKVVEFPITPFLVSVGHGIEFIHKSIYDYFVSEYIYKSIYNVINRKKSKGDLASILGRILKGNRLHFEILEFLKFKIQYSKLNVSFNLLNEVFHLMLRDGMTYYTNEIYKNVVRYEINIFMNMFDILYLFPKCYLEIDLIKNYIQYNKIGINMRGADLSNEDLSSIHFSGVDLALADLHETYLFDSDLSGADLRQANLREADLREANLRNADLRNADLSGADLSGADLSGANLYGANLVNANLNKSNLEGVNFIGINFEGANLRQSDLWNTNFRGLDLRGVNLSEANLSEADLRETHLEKAYLENINMQETHLEKAHLEETYLGSACLQGAHLEEAHLEGAYLYEADLRGAHLEGVCLKGANLENSIWRKEDIEKIIHNVNEGSFNFLEVFNPDEKNETNRWRKIHRSKLFF